MAGASPAAIAGLGLDRITSGRYEPEEQFLPVTDLRPATLGVVEQVAQLTCVSVRT